MTLANTIKLSTSFLFASFVSVVSANDAVSSQLQWQESQIANKASFRGSDAFGESLWISGSKNSVYLSIDKGKTWLNRSPNLAQQFDFRDIEAN